jgi:hypothetical protein
VFPENAGFPPQADSRQHYLARAVTAERAGREESRVTAIAANT